MATAALNSKGCKNRVRHDTKKLHQTLAANFISHEAFSALCFDIKIAFDLSIIIKLHVEAEEGFAERRNEVVINVLDYSTNAAIGCRHKHRDATCSPAYTTDTCLSMCK